MAEAVDGGDLAASVTPNFEYGLQETPPRRFEPWHRPRKQYVRSRQWGSLVEQLIDADGAALELTYLGLPGSDLLDIRYFHSRICMPRGLKLRFLGFNSSSHSSGAGVDLNTSLAEIHDLTQVHEQSDVIPDDFRSIANERSQAWARTSQMGPFDVVNIDLCDGFAGQGPVPGDPSYFDALQQLMSMQGNRARPWLLFLTTRVDEENLHPAMLEKFVDIVNGNLASCAPFLEAVERTWDFDGSRGADELAQTAEGLARLVSAGLSKWLISLAADHDQVAEFVQVDGYRVRADSEYLDLMSIALRISPIQRRPPDRHGIAQLDPREMPVAAECEQAVTVVVGLNSTMDVDSYLDSHDEDRAVFVAEGADLLRQARYPTAEYEAWLKKEDNWAQRA